MKVIYPRCMIKFRNYFLHQPIRKKLSIMVVFTTVFALLLSYVSFIAYDAYKTRKSIEKELYTVGSILSNRVQPTILFQNTKQAEDILADLRNIKSVLRACILYHNNEIFASYEKSNEEISCIGGKRISRVDFLHIETPIDQGDEYVLVIIADMHEFYVNFKNSTIVNTIVFLIALFISIATASRIQKLITAPIRTLTKSAQYIEESNDYSHNIKKEAFDEIGSLTDAFNNMIDKVRRRDSALNDANLNLENKVQERTKDLEKSKEAAEAASAAKSEFLQNMSHEFRTPLHGMKSFSKFGMVEYKEASRDELRGYFEKIGNVTDRLTILVNSVLDIARMQDGSEPFKFESLNLVKLIHMVEQEQEANLQRNELKLDIKIPEKEIRIVADRHKMIQVITNLIGNAIKFTPKGKSITVQVGISNNEVMVSVLDQGIGIPKGEEEVIFHKFIQSTRTNNGTGGTGLGLAICTGIIMAHKGKIWAENNKSDGTIFRFIIPIDLEEGIKNITVSEL